MIGRGRIDGLLESGCVVNFAVADRPEISRIEDEAFALRRGRFERENWSSGSIPISLRLPNFADQEAQNKAEPQPARWLDWSEEQANFSVTA